MKQTKDDLLFNMKLGADLGMVTKSEYKDYMKIAIARAVSNITPGSGWDGAFESKVSKWWGCERNTIECLD